ncbi:RING finger protein 222 [Molothrus ater]|uniref:RING finger protein 222 n=1 Tax=Molothrus ater TaxID=84834 RepID=UPI0023E874B5|nr:RING finger protein 222 [Molothrus ater]
MLSADRCHPSLINPLCPSSASTAGMSEPLPSNEAAPAECPVCYERFQPLEATHRRLSCGHTFCHDCLVKCLLSAKLGGHVQSSIVCPVCRFVTFLSRKKVLWLPRATDPRVLQVPLAQLARSEATNTLEVSLSPSSLSQLSKSEAPNTLEVPLSQLSKNEPPNTLEVPLSPSSLSQLAKSEPSHMLEVSLSPSSLSQLAKNESPNTLEVPLSPSSLSQLARSEPPNTLVVPSHFVLPEQSLGRVAPGAGLAREAHIFVISDHGMPLLAAQRCASGLPGGSGGDTASAGSGSGSGSGSSSLALGLQCCQSPMALAVMLVLTVAMLAAVLPWLLLVRRDL